VLGYGISVWLKDNNPISSEPVSVEVIPPVTPEGDGSFLPVDDSSQPISDTLDTLTNTLVPINDPIDLALRLEGKVDIPRTVPVEDLDRELGEEETFWVSNTDTAEHFQVDTTLAAVTDHLYVWVENGVDYSQRGLDRLATFFEETIYPTNQEFFGSEWSPGVDEDPHIYVIYAQGLGNGVAGYFSSAEEYPPEIKEYSNAHETFMLNADNQVFEPGYVYSVFAHEFQHMIHWYRDRNETSWLNEGFSELATLITGTRIGPTHDYFYADDPDTQLNDWPDDINIAAPHYGNSFLFVTYFMDRFGSEATKAAVGHELNGLTSIDKILEDLNINNPDTGDILTADDVVLDWMVTNYIKNAYNVVDRFKYLSYPEAPEFVPTETIDFCPTGPLSRDVHQYGVDYIELTCEGSYSLKFSGGQSVKVLPEDPHSGSFAFWSNKGDQSDMTLTREFDFTGVGGPILFKYRTWYDLELDFDYVFLEISTDGENWRIIRTPYSVSENPSGNSYGWGYNGLSGGEGQWIEESIDLSGYAGEVVQIRFEYITDDAYHGEGLLLDDVSIPAIDYFTDFEEDDGGWINEGFVRIENSLPQTYRLALIHLGAAPQVEFLAVPPDNQLEVPVRIGNDGADRVVLVVTGTTRFTRQLAEYQFELVSE
jgi:immune inhibitor A